MLVKILSIFVVLVLSGCESFKGIHHVSENLPSGPPPFTLTSLTPANKPASPKISPEMVVPDVRGNEETQGMPSLDPFPTVYFPFDSWEITSEVQDRLDATASWMSRFPGYELTIEGHTDLRGTESYNMILGVRRAKAVKDYLANLGIPRKRLEIVSYGKTLVLCEVDDEHTCHQFNRRADLLLE